jgi:hypothetical protein
METILRWLGKWDFERKQFGLNVKLPLKLEEVKIFWEFVDYVCLQDFHSQPKLRLIFGCYSMFQEKYVKRSIEHYLAWMQIIVPLPLVLIMVPRSKQGSHLYPKLVEISEI